MIFLSFLVFLFSILLLFFSALLSLTLTCAAHLLTPPVSPCPCPHPPPDHLFLPKQDKIVGNDVTHVQIDDPVHQIEAYKADGKHNARIFVNIRGRNAQKLVNILQGI